MRHATYGVRWVSLACQASSDKGGEAPTRLRCILLSQELILLSVAQSSDCVLDFAVDVLEKNAGGDGRGRGRNRGGSQAAAADTAYVKLIRDVGRQYEVSCERKCIGISKSNSIYT